MPKQSNLQIKTQLEALEDVLQWFEKIALQHLPEQLYWKCQLALIEGFTNAVRHAHQGLPPTTPIELEINLSANCLEIKVVDRGEPFDLDAEIKARLQEKEDKQNLDPMELAEGGRGLLWMYELMDELSYTRTADRRNCLFMRKQF